MERFELGSLLGERAEAGRPYLEFIRKKTLSVGLYVLPAGTADPQEPHTEDEVYYVVSGRARITVGEEDEPVGPGTTVFVAATVEHRFHTIEEDLQLIVFFAPAEYSNSKREWAVL